jgi:hypothetical protein
MVVSRVVLVVRFLLPVSFFFIIIIIIIIVIIFFAMGG